MSGRLAFTVLLATLIGCAHPVERRDWSHYEGPGAEFFQQEELDPPGVPDPVEPMNRSISVVNHGLMIGIVDPVSRVYRVIIPKFLRQRIQKFGANLLYPRRLMANLLQGKFREARDETYRFGINTTVGFAGFFDPASGWGIEPSDEDFGQTFAKWGWRPSTYLMLPGFGPSTVRDGIGLIPDSLLNPATYFFPAGPVLTFNEQVEFVEFYKRFTSTTYDPYHLTRLLWTLSREEKIADHEYEPEDTAQVQTLQSVFLSYEDPKYPRRMKTGSVHLAATGRELAYSYRMQDEAAPILFLVPGLGGHRLGNSSLALTEMAWKQGFSVATISSSMNFEFMERGASVAVPGHAPVDSRDVHAALDAIYRELDERHPGRITSRALMGYSLGAFHTFFIAAAERDPNSDLIDFDRYVTLDAPVNLLHGMQKLDAFFNAPLAFPPDGRADEVRTILLKTLDLAKETLTAAEGPALGADISRMEVLNIGEGDLAPAGPLPFSNLEAEFLIGLSFRIMLGSIIYGSQEREDLGVLVTQRGWFRRTSAYEEIADYSFAEYMHAFVLPYYRDRLRTVENASEFVAQNDLRFIAENLRGNEKIRHFANTNDFLTTDEDVAWLTQLLGEANVRFYERGGHLGGLHKPEVQAEVMQALSDLANR
jgi:ABC-type transporter lipoprotein component MlaA